MYIRRPYRIVALLLCCLILFPFTRIFALNRYLRVGVNCSLPPFQFLDDDGECVGMHIDMLNTIAKENSYEIDFVPYSSNTDCIKALDSGSIDIVLGMIPTALKDVKNFVCTDALTSSQLCMIVSNASIESDKPITTAMFSSDTIQHT
ncbi:MAG: transporter substrate-binding domain-containing protein, partial [Clostridiales bacterium]|nr:transporter substrate-binding domain-containing protein [Clostridiales bacterium]